MSEINLEFLVGLALIAVTLVALVYVIKGMVGDSFGGLNKLRHYFVAASEKFASREAKPVNDHLIGLIGNVTKHTGDSARPMSVRVNLELWSARSNSAADNLVAVGTSVKVTEVDGLMLVVEACDDVAELSEKGR